MKKINLPMVKNFALAVLQALRLLRGTVVATIIVGGIGALVGLTFPSIAFVMLVVLAYYKRQAVIPAVRGEWMLYFRHVGIFIGFLLGDLERF